MKYQFKKELYSKTALLKAAYNFTDKAFLHLDKTDRIDALGILKALITPSMQHIPPGAREGTDSAPCLGTSAPPSWGAVSEAGPRLSPDKAHELSGDPGQDRAEHRDKNQINREEEKIFPVREIAAEIFA